MFLCDFSGAATADFVSAAVAADSLCHMVTFVICSSRRAVTPPF